MTGRSPGSLQLQVNDYTVDLVAARTNRVNFEIQAQKTGLELHGQVLDSPQLHPLELRGMVSHRTNNIESKRPRS